MSHENLLLLGLGDEQNKKGNKEGKENESAMQILMEKINFLEKSLSASEKEKECLQQALCVQKNITMADASKESVNVTVPSNINANAAEAANIVTGASTASVTPADATNVHPRINSLNNFNPINMHFRVSESNAHDSNADFQTSPAGLPSTNNIFANNRWHGYEPSTARVTDYRTSQSYAPIRKLMDLPEFSGTPEAWPMFSVAYKESTDRYFYTNLENLMRLQKALKGEARFKVESSLIHPSGVNNVMDTLKFYYGRPELLVRSQIAKAQAFPTITNNKMGEIVNFSIMVANLASFLVNAGAEPHLQNPTLLDELVSKLPPSKREDWHRHLDAKQLSYPSVCEFSAWLKDLAKYVALSNEVTPTKIGVDHVSQKPKFSKTVCAVANGKRKCLLCTDVHELYYCTKFKDSNIDKKWEIVKSNRWCFCCLRAGHISQSCHKRRECGINSCRKSHNRLLHNETKSQIPSPEAALAVSTCQRKSSMNTSNGIYKKKTLLKFLPVKLYGPKGVVEIIAFIDEGAEVTLLEYEVAKSIGLKGPANALSLKWIDNKTVNEPSCEVKAEISAGHEGAERFQIKHMRTTKKLFLPSQTLDLESFANNFNDLKNISVNNYVDAVPKLLIGIPHTHLTRADKIINFDEGFAAHQTKLGWCVFGSNEQVSTGSLVGRVQCDDDDDDIVKSLKEQIKDYFIAETFEPKDLPPVKSQIDIRAENIMKDTTAMVEGKYETGLLWRNDNATLPNNYNAALKRLKVVEKRMSEEREFADWYVQKIKEYVDKSYAVQLTPTEASIVDDRTWYLPHFAVFNANKGNKPRLVFDAAAKLDGVSLNSLLMKGPDEYQPKSLLAILFKFRQGQFAVAGDIKEMFHRVDIIKADRNAQRFLWREGDISKPPDIYQMKAMIFGSACSPCSAQYVKNTLAKLFEKEYPRAAAAIIDHHYVDDFVDSFNDEKEAIEVTKRVIYIHASAGFELRGIISNTKRLVDSIEQESPLLVKTTKLLGYEEANEKILGMYWCSHKDNLCFKLLFSKVPQDVLLNKRPPTKAEVLSVMMSIFDPIGFLADVVLVPKIIMQQLWRMKMDWRDPIPENIRVKWSQWYNSLNRIGHFKAARCYNQHFLNEKADVQLHIFVDASESAFAAVAYWRVCYLNEVRVIFVTGKSRCSPLKSLSIPRLELQGAVLGVRLKKAVIDNHDRQPSKIFYWSDSRTVLHWIKSDARHYKQFVSHRISEILHDSKVDQWRWVPDPLNPGDDGTRPRIFTGDSKWLNGPQFLKHPEEMWPIPVEINESQDEMEERRLKHVYTIQEDKAAVRYDKYSELFMFFIVMTRVRYAINNFKLLLRKNRSHGKKSTPRITAEEMKLTEIMTIRFLQEEEYGNEVGLLKNKQEVPSKSTLSKLTPVIDEDGLIRLGGRIDNALCITMNVKRPIILPKSHEFTKLVVRHYHELLHHHFTIRQKYWIPQIRHVLWSVRAKCQTCKNLAAKPKTPLMGPLPKDRLTPFVRAFTYAGVDFMGPYFVAIGRQKEKRWVALYTCLTTRAIHLELARDLSTDAVILTLRNFINRRGVPVKIRSDCGTNFVGASKEGLVVLEKSLGKECVKKGIEWEFNTPADPSAGGIWERMVRAVKRVLSFTLKSKSPQIELFQSLLVEAENCINSRPLTHVPSDHDDAEPLTPNHFLLGCPNAIQTPKVAENVCLRKQWHILQQLKQTFWKRWVLEYLPELTRRTKWHQPVKPIRVGDIVIICDDNETRGQWKKGIIMETYPAPDGQVRSALVKTASATLRRPASKLAVLDVGNSLSI